eukprot:gnl/MRDRNA2_/MRDRNA2_60692_c0_seq1.p1 gnl/MRDRNA2_/MRDRNA2_60692_c0~~gnl/MRDRNA2_/MRDRNA2_60692_c0_seq1.p1  ORF type:complete len:303 (+),score=61.87 gnl/MRDRNA2_/MRDRNA2_60692_c0_seq1:82-990(+)
MCKGSSAPNARDFFKQKSQILRSNSHMSLDATETPADDAALGCVSGAVAARPWSALQQGTRPLSAQRNSKRPISAPRLRSRDTVNDEMLARFQDVWVNRRGAAVQKRKKPRDPFKDFLLDDPKMSQLIVEQTMEDAHIRSSKDALHHKAILGKLDAAACGTEDHLNFHSGQHSKSLGELPPAKKLHELQQHLIQSRTNLCEANPEAIGSFIHNIEQKRRQRLKDEKHHDLKKLKTQSSGNLNELKTMLKEVQRPKAKALELWNTSQATHFRTKYQKHHDQYTRESLDVAQAVRIYKDRCINV